MPTDLTDQAKALGLECDSVTILDEDEKIYDKDGKVLFDFAGSGEVGVQFQRGTTPSGAECACIVPVEKKVIDALLVSDEADSIEDFLAAIWPAADLSLNAAEFGVTTYGIPRGDGG